MSGNNPMVMGIQLYVVLSFLFNSYAVVEF